MGLCPSPQKARSLLLWLVTLVADGTGPSVVVFLFRLSFTLFSLSFVVVVFNHLLLSCFRRRFRFVVIRDNARTLVTIRQRQNCGT